LHTAKKVVQSFSISFNFDEHALRSVRDPASQLQFARKPVNERAESDTLHRSPNDDSHPSMFTDCRYHKNLIINCSDAFAVNTLKNKPRRGAKDTKKREQSYEKDKRGNQTYGERAV
jgi:hypothetical protein